MSSTNTLTSRFRDFHSVIALFSRPCVPAEAKNGGHEMETVGAAAALQTFRTCPGTHRPYSGFALPPIHRGPEAPLLTHWQVPPKQSRFAASRQSSLKMASLTVRAWNCTQRAERVLPQGTTDEELGACFGTYQNRPEFVNRVARVLAFGRGSATYRLCPLFNATSTPQKR